MVRAIDGSDGVMLMVGSGKGVKYDTPNFIYGTSMQWRESCECAKFEVWKSGLVGCKLQVY